MPAHALSQIRCGAHRMPGGGVVAANYAGVGMGHASPPIPYPLPCPLPHRYGHAALAAETRVFGQAPHRHWEAPHLFAAGVLHRVEHFHVEEETFFSLSVEPVEPTRQEKKTRQRARKQGHTNSLVRLGVHQQLSWVG